MRNDGGVKVGRDFNTMEISLCTLTIFFMLIWMHKFYFVSFIADMAARITMKRGAAAAAWYDACINSQCQWFTFTVVDGLSPVFSTSTSAQKLRIYEPPSYSLTEKKNQLFFCWTHTCYFLAEAWHYICSPCTQGWRVHCHRYMVVNSTLLLLMSALETAIAVSPPLDKRGAGSHICLFLTAAADNSINGSFTVTVLLDPSVTLSPKGSWIHLVSQKQLSDSEKYFSNWIRGFSKCLQMMPLMSALLECSSIVGNCSPVLAFSLCTVVSANLFAQSLLIMFCRYIDLKKKKYWHFWAKGDLTWQDLGNIILVIVIAVTCNGLHLIGTYSMYSPFYSSILHIDLIIGLR